MPNRTGRGLGNELAQASLFVYNAGNNGNDFLEIVGGILMETKPIVSELIVVEGVDDLQAVKRAVEAHIITTQGLGLTTETLDQIAAAQKRTGVIVFTDPDGPGETIRRWIEQAVPGVKHAFLPRIEARKDGDIGIENASPQAIRKALARVRGPVSKEGRVPFERNHLREWGLDGAPGSGRLRERLGEQLGLGRVNAKQFLQRINHFGLTEEEIKIALENLEVKG